MPPKRKVKSGKIDKRKTRQPVAGHPNPAPATECEVAATQAMNEALDEFPLSATLPPSTVLESDYEHEDFESLRQFLHRRTQKIVDLGLMSEDSPTTKTAFWCLETLMAFIGEDPEEGSYARETGLHAREFGHFLIEHDIGWLDAFHLRRGPRATHTPHSPPTTTFTG